MGHFLTRLGVYTASPLAFLVLIVYAALWYVFKPETFEWHAVATLATWGMTLVIQRAEHRDTQAIHAKLDEILHALGDARNEITRMDEKEPEEIERRREHMRKDDYTDTPQDAPNRPRPRHPLGGAILSRALAASIPKLMSAASGVWKTTPSTVAPSGPDDFSPHRGRGGLRYHMPGYRVYCTDILEAPPSSVGPRLSWAGFGLNRLIPVSARGLFHGRRS